MFIRLQRYEARAARARFHRSPLLQPQQILYTAEHLAQSPIKPHLYKMMGKE